MTAQIMEILIIDDKEHRIGTEPLEPYLNNLTEKPPLIMKTTACWRGYRGTWSLIGKKLYLIHLDGLIKIKDERHEYVLEDLFPNKTRVFAEWFSGDIRVPDGEMLEYVHADYGSIYENDLFLKFENGLLVNYDFLKNIKPSNETEINTPQKKEAQHKLNFPQNFLRKYLGRN